MLCSLISNKINVGQQRDNITNEHKRILEPLRTKGINWQRKDHLVTLHDSRLSSKRSVTKGLSLSLSLTFFYFFNFFISAGNGLYVERERERERWELKLTFLKII